MRGTDSKFKILNERTRTSVEVQETSLNFFDMHVFSKRHQLGKTANVVSQIYFQDLFLIFFLEIISKPQVDHVFFSEDVERLKIFNDVSRNSR